MGRKELNFPPLVSSRCGFPLPRKPGRRKSLASLAWRLLEPQSGTHIPVGDSKEPWVGGAGTGDGFFQSLSKPPPESHPHHWPKRTGKWSEGLGLRLPQRAMFPSSLCFFSWLACFIFFWLCPWQVGVPGPGTEPVSSSDLSGCHDNTSSLIHCATRELFSFLGLNWIFLGDKRKRQ